MLSFLRAYCIILLVLASSSYAELSSSSIHRHPIRRVIQHAHHVALRQSAGLARDLRIALRGVLVSEPLVPRDTSSITSAKLYCSSNIIGSGSSSSNSSSSSSSSGSGGLGSSVAPGIAPTASSNSGGSKSASGSSTATSTSPSSSASSAYKLVESHQGSNFFDGWSFFTGSDPTNGAVTYVDQSTAQSAGLAEVNSQGHAIMAVETTSTVSSTRQSVRITTNSQYSNGALVIMDSVHMPTGCGTWPAFWMNGPNWPAGGEIDIVEGVNTYTNNQATIHTNPGCTLPSSASSSSLGITGSLVSSLNCAAAETDNQGCGVRASQNNSFGAPFNQQGGGVYSMLWSSSGIQIWFFPRDAIPSDITAGAPNPSGWSTPMAFWPATDCSPFTYFSQISAIFDTTLCGDWAAGVWSSTGVPGQDVSCAASTGYSTCQAYVQAQGSAFSEAYWEVSYVKIYQHN